MKNKIFNVIFLVFLVFSALISCAGNTVPVKPENITIGDYSFMKEYMRWYLDEKMNDLNIIGGSIAIVDDGDIVWAEGFGYANKSKDIKSDPETVYGVGSVSKLFIATAIMQLHEKGELDIDKPVTEYIPEFNIKTRFDNLNEITVRTLMTHHSGLPSDKPKNMWGENAEDKDFRNIIEYLNSVHTAYPTDYVWSYSNLGVDLLGIIIENVSGKDFNEYIKENILIPLEMDDSSFYREDIDSNKITKGYISSDSEKELDLFALRDKPAGSMKSSVVDMSRFIEMMMNDGVYKETQILKSETVKEMLTVQNDGIERDFGFKQGLNWMLSKAPLEYAGKIATHGGDTLLSHAMLTILKDHNIGVIVLCNTNNGYLLTDDVANEALKLALETKKGIKPPEKVQDMEEIKLSPEELKQYEGKFATSMGLVDIFVKDGTLKITFGGYTLNLIPNGDDFLTLKEDPRVVFVVKTIDGVKTIALKQNGMSMAIGEEFQPYEIPQAWLDRQGEYVLTNPDNDILDAFDINDKLNNRIYLIEDNGILHVSMSSKIDVTNIVKPVNDTECIILGLGRSLMETVYAIDNDGTQELHFMGYIYEKVETEIR